MESPINSVSISPPRSMNLPTKGVLRWHCERRGNNNILDFTLVDISFAAGSLVLDNINDKPVVFHFPALPPTYIEASVCHIFLPLLCSQLLLFNTNEIRVKRSVVMWFIYRKNTADHRGRVCWRYCSGVFWSRAIHLQTQGWRSMEDIRYNNRVNNRRLHSLLKRKLHIKT